MTLAPPRPAGSKRSKTTTYVVIGAAVLLVALAIVWGLALGSTPAPKTAANAKAKVTVPLISASGQRTDVAVSGKPVTVVEFFAVWCPYCAYDARWVMSDFAAKVQQAGGRIFGVDASQQLGQAVPGPLGHPEQGIEGSHLQPPASQEMSMSLKAIAHYQSTFHLPFPLYYDEGLTYATQVGLRGYPSFLFYDAKGKAVVGLEGWQTEAQLWQAYQQAETK